MIKKTEIEFKNSIQTLREYIDIISETQVEESPLSQGIKAIGKTKVGQDIADMVKGGISGLQGKKYPPQGVDAAGQFTKTSAMTKAGHNFGKNIAPKIGAGISAGGAAGTASMMDEPEDTKMDTMQNTQAFPTPKKEFDQINPIGDMPTVNQPKPISANLKTIGTPDPIVKAAQQGLIAGGFLPAGSDDGIMGPKTQAAYAKYSASQPIREHVSFGHNPELARIISLARH